MFFYPTVTPESRTVQLERTRRWSRSGLLRIQMNSAFPPPPEDAIIS